MPSVRTAINTTSNKVSGTTLTIASVTLAAGDTLVIGPGLAANSMASASWNGHSLTQAATGQIGGNQSGAGDVWYWYEGTGGTGTLTVNMNQAMSASNGGAVWATKYTLLKNQAPLSTAGNDSVSSGTAASAGSVNALASGGAVVGNIVAFGPSTDGTPTSGLNLGQRVGTTGGTAGTNVTCNEIYSIPAGTGGITVSATLATSRNWSAAAVYFEPAPAGAANQQDRLLLGIG